MEKSDRLKAKPILNERLMYVLENHNPENYNKTTISKELGFSDVRVFRSILRKGEIKAVHLDKIGEILNVDPKYLSGEIDLFPNGEIPTYLTDQFWEKYEKWSQQHPREDAVRNLLILQGGDLHDYTDHQITTLTIRVCRLILDFIEDHSVADDL